MEGLNAAQSAFIETTFGKDIKDADIATKMQETLASRVEIPTDKMSDDAYKAFKEKMAPKENYSFTKRVNIPESTFKSLTEQMKNAGVADRQASQILESLESSYAEQNIQRKKDADKAGEESLKALKERWGDAYSEKDKQVRKVIATVAKDAGQQEKLNRMVLNNPELANIIVEAGIMMKSDTITPGKTSPRMGVAPGFTGGFQRVL